MLKSLRFNAYNFSCSDFKTWNLTKAGGETRATLSFGLTPEQVCGHRLLKCVCSDIITSCTSPLIFGFIVCIAQQSYCWTSLKRWAGVFSPVLTRAALPLGPWALFLFVQLRWITLWFRASLWRWEQEDTGQRRTVSLFFYEPESGAEATQNRQWKQRRDVRTNSI